MPNLTARLLEKYPYSVYADSKSLQKGRSYYREGRVVSIDLDDPNMAVCVVEGDSGDYTVEISVDQKSGELYFECECPYAEEHFCKHMIAAALEVLEFLKEEALEAGEIEDELLPPVRPIQKPAPPPAVPQWQSKLDSVLDQFPRTAGSGGNIQRYAAVLMMYRENYYYQDAFKIVPTIIKAKNWAALHAIQTVDAQAVNALLDANPEWSEFAEDLHQQTNPAGCLNLTPEGINFLQFLQQAGRVYGGMYSITPYFVTLAQFNIPIFVTGKPNNKTLTRIHIHPTPVDLQISFTTEKGSLVLRAGAQTDRFRAFTDKIEVLSSNPPWLLVGDMIFPLRNTASLPSLTSFPITIPAEQADLFREKYLRKVAERLPIQSKLVQWQEVTTAPVPRLYLHEDKNHRLCASLRFAYEQHEAAPEKNEPAHSIETIPDSWNLVRIHRQPEREHYFFQLLTDPTYLLKRADASQPYGSFELRARAHPFDFLAHAIPKLTQAGFEIYGEEQLKLGKINRATPTLRVNITSGIDWFDLKPVLEYGDQQIPLREVRKALKRGEHYVKLADGSVGQIPAEWLDKYRHLWEMAQETEDGFRVSDFHLPLVDSLLEDNAIFQIPADLAERRERLRSFEQINPQPLPRGFVGELRPYQKHGFDWLHFLREYKFGGILADDMGLGKTVQVLAYLQSLREELNPTSAALLIVPKSLIGNWQLESGRFTPGLRFLEYIGNTRSKDTALFDGYDVIITTYGTMLRDIEQLSQYRFHHVILDESQLIKNPLAKSAKAARLLNAEHRLVMTGTPVENNTFELWSQFAFLNPGLLGSMEYFRTEFANPIQGGQGQESAATLRKLIHPFILRRTKEQVAPELPPRTERVLYTEMEPAQKKLYAQTRDHYRAELLGLIETEGLNDARFKILEGLLRLRQIAIHPALVDKNYRGEAPKFELLLETLETLQVEGHKALIFSQFVETLRMVRQELDQRKIKYVYLDGRTRDRQACVDQFQNDPAFPFFLISLKAGGVGLNLTAADYVIHLDPWWNPAVEMQASDRAHRIGQDKPVFVYKIIARDTVEEKILQLQEKKRDLVKNLITAEESFFKSLTRDDVRMLFE